MRRAQVLLATMALVAVARGDARGDAPAPLAISLPQALAAVARAPAVQAGAHEVAAAEAQASAASAWPSPSIHLATSRLTARLIASAAVPLPVFGTVGAARRVGDAEAAVVRAETALALRALRHRVVLAWIELARAHADVEAQAVAAKQAADLVAIADGRQAAGTGAEVDVTLATAARARANVALATAHGAVRAASADLAGVLGWDPARELRADGALITGAADDDLAAWQGRLRGHPERAASARRIAAAEASVDQLRTARWPQLAIEGELDYDDPTITEGRTAWDRSDARVGIALDLPVFARTGDRIRAGEATAQAQRARLAALDGELAGALAAAHARWRAARERLAALERDVVPASEQAARLAMQAYREGARDLASALLAERELAAVRAEISDARAAAAIAFAELQLAAGEDPDAK